MVFCGNQCKGAGFPETSTYHKLRTGQRPWPTKETPCVGPAIRSECEAWQKQRMSHGNRNYVKPEEAVWLYVRRYEDGTIKYFVSNAPDHISYTELDPAATLRWPIEQCFEECKSYLGMAHYEGCSYPGWTRHMLFVMIAHLFTIQMRRMAKKKKFR